MTTPVTAALVKELRERTGVGMAKCKEALDQASGNMQEAIDILRKAGIASAVKKQGRETKEGAVFVHETADAIALVEVNAETDFVVKNDKFQEYGKKMAEEVARLKPASLDAFLASPSSEDKSITIDGRRALIVQLIGENIVLKRLLVIPKAANRTVGFYSHMGGKIVTVVELDGSDSEQSLTKDIAMHIAAANPEFTRPEEIPEDVIAKEKEIAASQLAGKPANIMDKILAGKLNAFFDQVCLVRQKFVKDDSMTIDALVQKRAKECGKTLHVVRFFRWMIGQ
jgi:elongation factor Ts